MDGSAVATYLDPYGYKAAGPSDWQSPPGKSPGAPTLELAVNGHGERSSHTFYAVSCRLTAETPSLSLEWLAQRRLAQLREELHDIVKSELGDGYGPAFSKAPFAKRGGPSGTTERLQKWLEALAACVNEGAAPPMLVAQVLRFLEAPEREQHEAPRSCPQAEAEPGPAAPSPPVTAAEKEPAPEPSAVASPSLAAPASPLQPAGASGTRTPDARAEACVAASPPAVAAPPAAAAPEGTVARGAVLPAEAVVARAAAVAEGGAGAADTSGRHSPLQTLRSEVPGSPASSWAAAALAAEEEASAAAAAPRLREREQAREAPRFVDAACSPAGERPAFFPGLAPASESAVAAAHEEEQEEGPGADDMVSLYLAPYGYAVASPEEWRFPPKKSPGTPTLALSVNGHGERDSHTFYDVHCWFVAKKPTVHLEWLAQRRLASLREELHDVVKNELGKGYTDVFAKAPFAKRGGPSGTTLRLQRWLEALAACVNDGTAPPALVAQVLLFLGAPAQTDHHTAAEQSSGSGQRNGSSNAWRREASLAWEEFDGAGGASSARRRDMVDRGCSSGDEGVLTDDETGGSWSAEKRRAGYRKLREWFLELKRKLERKVKRGDTSLSPRRMFAD